MKILTVILILISASFAFGQTESRCFQNDALKGTQFVNLETNGKRVSGTFEYENGESELARKYNFSGTMAGDVLRVRFDGDELPDVAPSEMKDLNWRLLKTADGEILRIKFYGKNYETNKYADYFADFVSCEPSYATLAQQAKRVSFAKGAKSAAFALSFQTQSERKAFRLGAQKGQTISVMSPGCGISVYYPDKTADQEGGIDTFSLENITQSGDYLFVISPAGEPGDCATSFEINK